MYTSIATKILDIAEKITDFRYSLSNHWSIFELLDVDELEHMHNMYSYYVVSVEVLNIYQRASIQISLIIWFIMNT